MCFDDLIMMLWDNGPRFHERKIWQKIEMEGGSNLELRASEEDALFTMPGLPDPSVFINMMGDQKSKGGK